MARLSGRQPQRRGRRGGVDPYLRYVAPYMALRRQRMTKEPPARAVLSHSTRPPWVRQPVTRRRSGAPRPLHPLLRGPRCPGPRVAGERPLRRLRRHLPLRGRKRGGPRFSPRRGEYRRSRGGGNPDLAWWENAPSVLPHRATGGGRTPPPSPAATPPPPEEETGRPLRRLWRHLPLRGRKRVATSEAC